MSTVANTLKSLYDNLVIGLNFINEGINKKADKVFLVENTDYNLLPGCIYRLGILDGETIILSTEGGSQEECLQWHFYFTAGANAPLWSDVIVWASTPEFTEGTSYEVDVILVGSTFEGIVLEKEATE